MDMTVTATRPRASDSLYSFIADAGAVTRADLVGSLGIDDAAMYAWLRRQVQAGYPYRDVQHVVPVAAHRSLKYVREIRGSPAIDSYILNWCGPKSAS